MIQSTSRVKGHQTCKQQKTRLYRYHTNEMRSFEGSEFTFSVDRRYGVSKRLGLFDLDCDLLFVRVMQGGGGGGGSLP